MAAELLQLLPFLFLVSLLHFDQQLCWNVLVLGQGKFSFLSHASYAEVYFWVEEWAKQGVLLGECKHYCGQYIKKYPEVKVKFSI